MVVAYGLIKVIFLQRLHNLVPRKQEHHGAEEPGHAQFGHFQASRPEMEALDGERQKAVLRRGLSTSSLPIQCVYICMYEWNAQYLRQRGSNCCTGKNTLTTSSSQSANVRSLHCVLAPIVSASLVKTAEESYFMAATQQTLPLFIHPTAVRIYYWLCRIAHHFSCQHGHPDAIELLEEQTNTPCCTQPQLLAASNLYQLSTRFHFHYQHTKSTYIHIHREKRGQELKATYFSTYINIPFLHFITQATG